MVISFYPASAGFFISQKKSFFLSIPQFYGQNRVVFNNIIVSLAINKIIEISKISL
jgi:hypothetical protein